MQGLWKAACLDSGEIPSVWGAQLRPHEGPGVHRGSAEIHLTVQGQFLNISSKQGKERMNFHAFLQEMLGNSCCSIRSFTNAKVHICLSLNPEAAPWVGPRPAPPLSPGHSGAGSAWPQAGSALRSPQREKRKLTIRGTHEIEVREALCSFTDSECKDIITGCNLFQALWFSAYSPCTYL